MRCISVLFVLASCSVDHTGLLATDAPTTDAAPDTFDSGPVFNDPDAQVDALASDTGSDTPDASIRDVGVDAPVDVGVDAPVDVGVDAPVDVGVDAPVDVGVDAPIDVGVDAPVVDAGPSCTDGLLNGDESDVDCGGSCDRCLTGATCRLGADCETHHCDADDVRCRLPSSCFDLLSGDTDLETGAYAIDPDESGAGESFMAWCDMDFDEGGWTLVVSSGSVGPNGSTEGEPMPGTTLHLSRSDLQPLVLNASQVHIRTRGRASDRSATSMPGTTPIENLRSFEMLEIEVGGPTLSWTGPLLANIGYRCEPANETYPNVFHACGNAGGLHWFRGSTKWVNTDANEDLEMYVR